MMRCGCCLGRAGPTDHSCRHIPNSQLNLRGCLLPVLGLVRAHSNLGRLHRLQPHLTARRRAHSAFAALGARCAPAVLPTAQLSKRSNVHFRTHLSSVEHPARTPARRSINATLSLFTHESLALRNAGAIAIQPRLPHVPIHARSQRRSCCAAHPAWHQSHQGKASWTSKFTHRA